MKNRKESLETEFDLAKSDLHNRKRVGKVKLLATLPHPDSSEPAIKS
jgi:hypothetical protein